MQKENEKAEKERVKLEKERQKERERLERERAKFLERERAAIERRERMTAKIAAARDAREAGRAGSSHAAPKPKSKSNGREVVGLGFQFPYSYKKDYPVSTIAPPPSRVTIPAAAPVHSSKLSKASKYSAPPPSPPSRYSTYSTIPLPSSPPTLRLLPPAPHRIIREPAPGTGEAFGLFRDRVMNGEVKARGVPGKGGKERAAIPRKLLFGA